MDDKEMRQLGQSYKKSDAIQKEIARQRYKLQTRTKRSKQLLIIQEWSQEGEYLKEHNRTIIYAKNPIMEHEKPIKMPNATKNAPPQKGDSRIYRSGRRGTIPPRADQNTIW